MFSSVANCLNEFDEQEHEDFDDVEMASIAEEEDLDEKFSHRGTSTGKVSGRKKIVRKKFKLAYKQFDCKVLLFPSVG
jgi:hypothetical protein